MENLFNPLWSWLPRTIQLFQTRQNLIKGFRSFPGLPSHWLYGHADRLDFLIPPPCSHISCSGGGVLKTF
uniref:Uncharacterized protein n=1 Tax=Podarcis muralis TaxID=64176 RepID=A0A670III0_PODMU